MGRIEDLLEGMAVSDARIALEGTDLEIASDSLGLFVLQRDLVPDGDHLLTVSKWGYEPREISIYVAKSKKLVFERIGLLITDKERTKRNATKKKNGEDRISKKLIQENKNLIQENQADSSYYEDPQTRNHEGSLLIEDKPQNPIGNPEQMAHQSSGNSAPEPSYTEFQLKYAKTLEVPPEQISNMELYSFIDDWLGTPYKMGGNNKSGVDCSSFALALYGKVYGQFTIGRTAQQQLEEAYNRSEAFKNPKHLEEGDLLFFSDPGKGTDSIIHVGIYLANNKFVNATSRKGPSGVSGVKISDLKEVYWLRRFRAAGRW